MFSLQGNTLPRIGNIVFPAGEHITQDREHCSPCRGTYYSGLGTLFSLQGNIVLPSGEHKYPGWGTLFSLQGNILPRMKNIVLLAGKHITEDREHCSPCRGTYYPGWGTLFSLQGNILPRIGNIVLPAGEHITQDREHCFPCRGTHYPG